jgi:proteasome lid subunit RPN8/RPN11
MRQGHIGDRLLRREHPRDGRRRERGAATAEIVGLRAASAETIYRHVFENADREVGGVLVGRMPGDGGLPLITAAIPAISADEQRATLTFTQQAWAHVHRVLDTEFPPDEQIVGWYHSHPGFGIFLSGHDLFIHENFFSAPSQIAVVVDPLACTEGAFAWREGKLQALFEQPTPPSWKAPAGIAEMRFEHSRLDAPAADAGRGPSAQIAHDAWLPPALLLAAVLCALVFLILLLTGFFGSGVGAHTGSRTEQRSSSAPHVKHHGSVGPAPRGEKQ